MKTGSFTQDAQGHWYVNFQCEVEDTGGPLGRRKSVLIWADESALVHAIWTYPTPESNLTGAHEQCIGLAQSARKKKRVQAPCQDRDARTDWTHKTTTAIVNRATLIVCGQCLEYETCQNAAGQIRL